MSETGPSGSYSRPASELAAIGNPLGLPEALVGALDRAVHHNLGEDHFLESMRPVGGGCIHRAYALECRGARLFAKVNDPTHWHNFTAEEDGLKALARTGMTVPSVVSLGTTPGHAYLLLRFMDLGTLDGDSARALGRALATMHARDAGTRYGWHCANYIGATPQSNGWHDDWASFWAEERIAPQLVLAKRNALGDSLQRLGARLLERIPALIAGHAPKPALVHGDLWAGNAGALGSGEPVVFDPAVYVGDAEVDLAMTELFGGFPAAFYAGYAGVSPIMPGYEARKPLYNLYHVLNHANLFGGGYVAQAERSMTRLLN
jgi:fructosamine-3-kinase